MRTGPGHRRAYALWASAAAFACLSLIAAAWLVAEAVAPDHDAPQSSRSENTYFAAPTFTLVDQNGTSISSDHFDGKIQVVSFLFPYCVTDCPLLAKDLVEVQKDLVRRGLGDQVELVTFNVDPAGAGPRQLGEFIAQYGGDATTTESKVPWHFLTGAPADVRRAVTDGYFVSYTKTRGAEEGGDVEPNPLAERAGVDYDVTHANVVLIVDGDGHVVDLRQGITASVPDAVVAAVEKAAKH